MTQEPASIEKPSSDNAPDDGEMPAEAKSAVIVANEPSVEVIAPADPEEGTSEEAPANTSTGDDDDVTGIEMVTYPGPAESPEIPSNLFTRVIWRAELEKDWYALSALRLAAERDLRERGINQWTDTARGLEQMVFFVNRDEMYLVREGPSAVACFVLTGRPDPDFWADDTERHECLYLHKMIVAPWARDTGLGQFIVDHAMAEADERCCSAVRLDCWKDNEKLKSHFESLGFTYLRTVETPGRNDGVLMERRLVPLPSGDEDGQRRI